MTIQTPPPRLSKSVVFTFAGEALADPRTVRKVLAGEPVRGDVADRIRTAARRRGLLPSSTEKANP